MNEIEKLRDKYKNTQMKALLLATGPSINLYKSHLKYIPDDYIVICIKSSYDIVPNRCDYHLLNNLKLKKYKYGNKKPYVVYASATNKTLSYANLSVKLKSPTMARTDKYDRLLDFDLIKQWGPGIMYDLALPFVYFLGFESVTIIGWDLFPIGQSTNLHFDGKYGHKKSRRPIKYKNTFINEADLINLTSGKVYRQCVSKNFKLYIASHSYYCNVDKSIPRLFCPLWGFDPYLHLMINYKTISEYSLIESYNSFYNTNQVKDYNMLFYLQYICSYSDLTEIVLDNIKNINPHQHDLILNNIINLAEYHYNDVGKLELFTGKRPISVFDPWIYISSHPHTKTEYWNIYINTLDEIKVCYTWITIGFKLKLDYNIHKFSRHKDAYKFLSVLPLKI